MFYKEEAEALVAAAEFLAGNEWVEHDANQNNTNSPRLNLQRDGIIRGVVTVEAPAAQKDSGPPVKWTAGLGGRVTIYDQIGIGTATTPGTWIDGSNGQNLELKPEDSANPDDSEAVTSDFVNYTEEVIPVDQEILMFYVGERLCVFPLGEAGEAPKRVKFKLTEPLCKSGSLQSGFADALIIDSMNSGYAIGSILTVWDYKKQFTTSEASAIGIAVFDDPYANGLQWHIEECEQLINQVEGNLVNSIGPWMQTSAEISGVTAQSTWPYVQWYGSETEGSTISPVLNTRRFTAGSGPEGNPQVATARRVIPNAYLPDPDNNIAPYTLEPLTPVWDLTSVKYPTARWSQSLYSQSAGTFNLDTSQFAEGYSPDLHSEITNGEEAPPPPAIKNEFDPYTCNVPNNTAGWSFLDDSSGSYITIATASSLFGAPTKVSAVAKIEGSANDLLIDNEGTCGVIEHELLLNALVWGDVNGPGTGCRMENVTPKPEVDVLADATDVEVVTSVAINGNGDLEMQRSTIKACDSPGSNQTIALTQMDVVNDVYCSADLLTKDYSTIKFLGSTVSSNQGVDLPCTNPANYNWETIFNNYVYNEAWWNVSYYDITWPDGCDPCPDSPPTGCCTATAYPNGQDGITEADCLAETGYVSWTEGTCGGGGSPCENTVVSGFSIGGFATTGCSATFTQTGTATITGGTATINGTWSGLANNFPVGSIGGTFTFTTDGTNHTASGTLPSIWGGGTVSVSDTGTCGGTYQGTATLSGGNFPCGSMINGTYDFILT